MEKLKKVFIEEIIKKTEDMYLNSILNDTDNEYYKFIQSINKELDFDNYIRNNIKTEEENIRHILETILNTTCDKNYCICEVSTSGFSIENKDLLFEFKKRSNLLMGYKDLNYSFIEFKDNSVNTINLRPPKNSEHEKVYVLLEKIINIKMLSEFQNQQKIFNNHKEVVEVIFKEINKLPFNVVKSLENINLLKMTKEEIEIIRLEHDINVINVISSIKDSIFLNKNEVKNTI